MKSNKGLTLVELMVAMAIGVIILISVMKIYSTFIKSTASMEQSLEAQLEGRAGAQRLVKELRGAGCYYTGTPVHTALSDEIEFESDTDPDPSNGPWLIKYQYDAVNEMLLRSDAEWVSGAYGAYTAAQELAGHITGITFKYYDATGVEIATPIASQANRDLIRKVSVLLTARPDNPNPNTGNYDTINIQTGIQMRCMGVQQSTDTTECLLPTNLAATDPSSCGKLNLTWTKSASSDAAGYRVFYKKTGLSAYTGVFDVPGGSTQAVTMTGLQNGVQYDVAMKCFDTAGNVNVLYAGPITGTVSPLDTKPDDSIAPFVPTGTDATADDGTVTLSWVASSSPDTGGYNIYRSDDGGSTYALIEDVDSTVLTYTDSALENCPVTPFYYKVMAWDCAANELPLSGQSAVFGDATLLGGITDAPTNGTTSTYPKDLVPPSDPTDFVAVAGADKIYLSYTSSPDTFDGTRILRRDDLYPVNETDSVAVGPNLTKDYSPQVSNQTYTLIDSASIFIGTTYFYRSFAYDSCMNFSAGILSTATAKPCGDGLVGSEHYGPPLTPASLTSLTCDFVALSWPASTGSETGFPFAPISESDVVGYNVYRATVTGGPYTKLNTTPITSLSYSDTTVATGITYYYAVKSVDCADNESSFYSPETVVAPNDIDWDPGVTVITSGTPGLDGSQHNVVTLALEALSNSSMVIDSAVMTWNVDNAFLKSVTLSPEGVGTNVLWDDTVMPLSPSGTDVNFASYQPDQALRRIAANSVGNILELDFRNFANTGFVNMGGSTINFIITYTSDNDAALCTTATFSVPVTRGPVILQTTQDKPVDPTSANLTPGVVSVQAGVQDPITYAWTYDEVTVTSNISPEAGTTITDAKLFVAITDETVTVAPVTDYSLAPAGWTAFDMCQSGTSTIYQNASSGLCSSSPIPQNTGDRIWYYIRAVDSNGNVGIEPDPAVGIYTYDQQGTLHPFIWVGRDGVNADGVFIWDWFLSDQDNAQIGGAKVEVTIYNQTTGATEKGEMVDLEAVYGPGAYRYPDNVTSSPGYDSDIIDVSFLYKRSGYTNTMCKVTNVAASVGYPFSGACY